MRRRVSVAVAGVAALAGASLAGCSSAAPTAAPAPAAAPRLSVSGAYVPLPSMPDMAAGYFVLRNTGDRAATLTGVTSPQATSVSMHESTATTMVDLTRVEVPAHGSVAFRRGGRHLMLMGLTPTPTVGRQVRLELRFDDAPPVTVEATVQPMTYQPTQ